MNENEQMIRGQAYELWDHAGRPGRSDEFWFAARAEFERRRRQERETSARMFPRASSRLVMNRAPLKGKRGLSRTPAA
jgi:Protein of unknown function (DUF2934)